MTVAAQKQVVEKALALPKKARESLAKQLWKSLEPNEEKISRKEWNGAWKVELEKRIADIESGRVKCVPYPEVRKRLDKILGRA
ncbi:MAG TPA: addiction module protein [Candidatus Methylacidiphilales bacterium]|jgi:putative addiction module component (TIGR02574 family)|nr:addiction module protein [Candidatus Methylacidiphilales bacterium]